MLILNVAVILILSDRAQLVARACTRALRLVDQSGPVVSDAQLASVGVSLAELVMSGWLPYAQFRRALVSYVAVLAARCRTTGAIGEVASNVRDLGSHGQENVLGARAEALILAMGGLGIAQADCAEVHAAVGQAIRGLAARMRASGFTGEAGHALDALVDVVDARVGYLLRDPRIPELERVPGSAEENGPETGALSRMGLGPVTDGSRFQHWWPTVSMRSHGFGVAFSEAPEPPSHPLPKVVARFAEDGVIGTHELAGALRALAAESHPVAEADPDREDFRRRSDSSEAYDLHGDTVAALTALLPAPFPDSTAWPGGWQGRGELDRDVRRIAGLAAAPYLRGQYPPSTAVEEALEQVAAMLRREPKRLGDFPADRTGWRDPPSAVEEGGPASSTAASLGLLMELAFRAGFDRRALLTGRRILAAATRSAQVEDVHGLLAHRNAIQVFTRDAVLHGPTSGTRAGRHRQRTVLAGMIAEIDQLLEQQKNPLLKESIDDIASNLTWRAHGSAVFELQAQPGSTAELR